MQITRHGLYEMVTVSLILIKGVVSMWRVFENDKQVAAYSSYDNVVKHVQGSKDVSLLTIKKVESEVSNSTTSTSGSTNPTTTAKLANPMKSYRLTSRFAQRGASFHYGVDLCAPLNTPIYAAADGKVVRSGTASGYGHMIGIEHEKGKLYTIYGHMYKDGLLVKEGQTVKKGDKIALVGSDGVSSAPHLHFAVCTSWFPEKDKGHYKNPEDYITF